MAAELTNDKKRDGERKGKSEKRKEGERKTKNEKRRQTELVTIVEKTVSHIESASSSPAYS
jgi:hypothetical protein